MNGSVHLAERRTVHTRAALVVDGLQAQILEAGRLRDGRPVTVEIRTRRTH